MGPGLCRLHSVRRRNRYVVLVIINIPFIIGAPLPLSRLLFLFLESIVSHNAIALHLALSHTRVRFCLQNSQYKVSSRYARQSIECSSEEGYLYYSDNRIRTIYN